MSAIMESLFEIFVQLFGELLLQLFAEILFELGLRSLSEPFRHEPNAWLAAFGYTLFGVGAGGFSLLFHPALMIASPIGRLINLGLTPVIAGCTMAAIGAWRRSRDQEIVRIDRFAYGYLFAFAMALVRFGFGQ